MSRGPEVPFPEPPWLTALVDQRMALMKSKGVFEIAEDTKPMIFTHVTEPAPGVTSRARDEWERTCDNCGRYCRPESKGGGMEFYTGHVVRNVEGRQVLLAYGVCNDCRLASTP